MKRIEDAGQVVSIVRHRSRIADEELNIRDTLFFGAFTCRDD
jgi:hypothetical protein